MITTYNFTCIEQLSEQIKHVDSVNLQLKKGKYYSKFSQIIKNNHILHQVYSNISSSSEGETHEDFYMFLLIRSKDKQVFRNSSLNHTSIIVMEPKTQYSKFSFGESTALIAYIPKQEIEEKFGSLSTGVYDVKNQKIIDEILYLTFILFNSKQLNNHLIECYSALIIEKIQASLVNIHSLCNNCKQCKKCIKFYEIVKFMKKEYKHNLEITEIAEHFNITDRTRSV